MRTQGELKKAAESTPKGATERERHLREAAAADPVLREQTRNEVEESPYLDTEGGD